MEIKNITISVKLEKKGLKGKLSEIYGFNMYEKPELAKLFLSEITELVSKQGFSIVSIRALDRNKLNK